MDLKLYSVLDFQREVLHNIGLSRRLGTPWFIIIKTPIRQTHERPDLPVWTHYTLPLSFFVITRHQCHYWHQSPSFRYPYDVSLPSTFIPKRLLLTHQTDFVYLFIRDSRIVHPNVTISTSVPEPTPFSILFNSSHLRNFL